MKIRNRHLVRAAGRLGSICVRGLVSTLRDRVAYQGPDVGRGRARLPDRLIYSIWHENLLYPAAQFGGPDLAVLISAHADGQILGGLITAMGMEMVRGSSTRGGVEAVRQLIKPDTRWKNLAVTPDGPRGPRRIVQPGMIYVASRTGMKIVCVGVAYDRPWRLKSWDRFAIPRPFSRTRAIGGDPITVPQGLKSSELEEYRLQVQSEMDRLDELAMAWLQTGLPPEKKIAAPAQSPPIRQVG